MSTNPAPQNGLALLGSTAPGFALTGGTPTMFTWTAPADGNFHRVQLFGEQVVSVAETGGAVTLTITDPGGTVRARSIFPGTSGTGFSTVPGGAVYVIQSGSPVIFAQSSALTAGAATLYIEMWGS